MVAELKIVRLYMFHHMFCVLVNIGCRAAVHPSVWNLLWIDRMELILLEIYKPRRAESDLGRSALFLRFVWCKILSRHGLFRNGGIELAHPAIICLGW